MQIDILIPSKNRPAQLDLLLRSIKKYFHNVGRIFIIIKATKPDFVKGYRVKDYYEDYDMNILPIHEDEFAREYKSVLMSMTSKYYLGISDDCVFIDDCNIPDGFELENDEIALSLRLSNRNTYCQPGQFDMIPPEFTEVYRPSENIIIWEWAKTGRGDYQYTASPDSQVYNRNYFIQQVQKSGMKSLRDLEIFMDNNRPTDKPYMLSFKDCKLVSIAANTVWEADWTLPNMGVSTESMNEKWLAGYQIKLPEIKDPKSCHIYYNFIWEKA